MMFDHMLDLTLSLWYRWPKGRLTYRIIKYPESERLSKSQVDVEIKRAFQLWEDHTNLIIERKDSGGVDIEISFAISEHGDENPFDGLGGLESELNIIL